MSRAPCAFLASALQCHNQNTFRVASISAAHVAEVVSCNFTGCAFSQESHHNTVFSGHSTVHPQLHRNVTCSDVMWPWIYCDCHIYTEASFVSFLSVCLYISGTSPLPLSPRLPLSLPTLLCLPHFSHPGRPVGVLDYPNTHAVIRAFLIDYYLSLSIYISPEPHYRS